jgi:DNA mismatch repair ATPase MutL
MNFLKINLTPIEEDSQIPLLIGEPFKLENEEVRLFLKPFGFNFEKIEENKMILLSIPPYLSELPFRKIVGLLLNSLSKEEKEFDGFPFDDIKQWELKVSFSQIKHLIKPFEENLLNEDFAKVLDDKYLNSLFL